jgi:CTP synthase
MRLGVWPCRLTPGTRAAAAYDQPIVYERHRHRYEFNNEYRELLTAGGMVLSGLSPDGRLVEIIELEDHPWFVGSQFHPEFKSRPDRPHPLFQDFVGAAKAFWGDPADEPVDQFDLDEEALASRMSGSSH